LKPSIPKVWWVPWGKSKKVTQSNCGGRSGARPKNISDKPASKRANWGGGFPERGKSGRVEILEDEKEGVGKCIFGDEESQEKRRHEPSQWPGIEKYIGGSMVFLRRKEEDQNAGGQRAKIPSRVQWNQQCIDEKPCSYAYRE